jgi:AcrR family transcriptional regulator
MSTAVAPPQLDQPTVDQPTVDLPAAAPPSRRGEARTQAILDAAVELVTEVGYERMTMGAIATRARASKATMYRRWGGKAELVAEAFRCHQCADVHCPPDTGSLRGDLLALIHAMVESFSGEDGQRIAGLFMAMRLDPDLAGMVRAQIDETGRALTDTLLGRAADRGEPIRSIDPRFIFDLAPKVILTKTLLLATPPDAEFQRKLVDDVILPLLSGGPDDSRLRHPRPFPTPSPTSEEPS